MRIISSPAQAFTPTVVALGNFDGIHQGHRQVIRPVVSSEEIRFSQIELWRDRSSFFHRLSVNGNQWPERGDSLASNDFVRAESQQSYSTVVTFHPHPQEFFTGYPRTLLTPLPEKVFQLQSLTVQQLVLLPFDRELASLTPEQFVEKILSQQLQAARVSVGQDFRFGQKRAGSADDLRAIAASYGIEVTIVPLQTSGEERISSSLIRQSLESGNLQQANYLLGRPYSFVGSVVRGQQLGRTLGFPTANLQLPANKLIPRWGVYAVRVYHTQSAADPETAPTPLLGVMNIGCRPTVEGTAPTIEIHLLDWSGDLYGQTLIAELFAFLRPEKKFSSLESLKTQIQADCALTREKLLTA